MYKVIASSSKGNSYLVHGEILIDVGVSLSRLTPYLDKTKIILLTHAHSDHFNKKTISEISMLYPHITFVCGEWLESTLIRLNVGNYQIISTSNEWLKIGEYRFYPIELFHGDRRGQILNYGYRILKGNHRTIHMTDTGTYEGINAKDYDIIAIEANHCENLIEEMVKESMEKGDFSHGYFSRKYHASFQKAQAFIDRNSKEETKHFLLHPSDTFLTEAQHEQIIQTWR